MKKYFFVLLLCAAAGAWAQDVFELPEAEEPEEDNRSAAEILYDCTRVIPTEPTLLRGMLTVRMKRGTVLVEHPFTLLLDWGANPPTAECLLFAADGRTQLERALMARPKGMPAQIRLYQGTEKEAFETPAFSSRIRMTDITWLDLTLDFLWWNDVRFDEARRGTCRVGRKCHILLVRPPEEIAGCSAVRVWVDTALCCIMQAEQLDASGKPTRMMWVQNVKKMDDRWMIRDMEVEMLNSGHRTRLRVDESGRP